MNQTINCDFRIGGEPCGKIADGAPFDGHIGGVSTHMDLCKACQPKAQQQLLDMGASPSAISVGRKRRTPHVAKSGKIFSTAEARIWLIRNGHLDPDTKGRVAQELIDLYGEHH